MKVGIPYDLKKIFIEIPDRVQTEIIYPNEVTKMKSGPCLFEALENPLKSVSFDEFISHGDELLFIVNDATRPTPTAEILDILKGSLKGKRIKFLVATGTHRPPTVKEIRSISGHGYDEFKENISVHDARADSEMVRIGTNVNGNEILINRTVADAKKIVTINSVEPHYFAGFTGGRKSFFPGVASYGTVEGNHRLAMNPEAQSLRLTGNPVHEDMMDSLRLLDGKEIFSIQAVLDRDHDIYVAAAGDIRESFFMATRKALAVFSVRTPQKADIVVSVVLYPKDVNLYQCQNAMENGKRILKEGGILIMVSACREGIGPLNFFELLSSCQTAEEVPEKLKGTYKLGYHKAAKYAETIKTAEIWAVTGLPESQVKQVFMKPYSSLQQAIVDAVRIKGERALAMILMDGDKTVPLLEN
jgi:nickel-dependent lactate racemase